MDPLRASLLATVLLRLCCLLSSLQARRLMLARAATPAWHGAAAAQASHADVRARSPVFGQLGWAACSCTVEAQDPSSAGYRPTLRYALGSRSPAIPHPAARGHQATTPLIHQCVCSCGHARKHRPFRRVSRSSPWLYYTRPPAHRCLLHDGALVSGGGQGLALLVGAPLHRGRFDALHRRGGCAIALARRSRLARSHRRCLRRIDLLPSVVA